MLKFYLKGGKHYTMGEALSFLTVLNTIQITLFEDSKGAIRIRKSKTDRQYNDHKKKDKQRSTKHYTKTKIEQHEVHTNRM